MSRHWHKLARAMRARGLRPCQIGAIMRVSEAAVSRALRSAPQVPVPAWVRPDLADDFRALAAERGRAVAEAWARHEARWGAAP